MLRASERRATVTIVAASFLHTRSMSEVQDLPPLSSVVLLRLRDYARRPVAEQARLSAQLETALAVLLPDIAARERLVLEGSGVAAVAVLGKATAALDFAERALRANEAGLGLSIGIDHGPVEVTGDASGNALAGDGVATAAVLATFAAETGLLVSKNFYTALAQSSPGAESVLVPAGGFSDAGLRTYQAFRVDREAPRRRRRRFIIAAAAVIFALSAAAVALRVGAPDRPRPLAPYVDRAVSYFGSYVFDRLMRFVLDHQQE